ncbi:hypothetical protein MKW94_019873 [Papaver nudicaule]|uniref:Uncharacterized protein n=1 Tax=Papaver nudicaule TaxID=74823 RepID=A0AA41SHX7_PAPNU|nr:hypothetical protein [Papaver nudicaule]
MATSAISFRPVIKASSGNGKADVNHQRRNQAASPNWWTPIFGWKSEPDYIENSSKPSGSGKFTPGCFTEEKAKQLRIKAMESANFHDIMYHSAIASRLASDVPIRNDL